MKASLCALGCVFLFVILPSCGDDTKTEETAVDIPLDGTKPLSQLNAEESTKVAEAVKQMNTALMKPERICRLFGMMMSTFNPDPNACQSAVDTCIKQVNEKGVESLSQNTGSEGMTMDMANIDPAKMKLANCQANVQELEDCLVKIRDGLVVFFDSISCSTKPQEVKTDPIDFEATCTNLKAKCPDFFTATPTDT